MESEGIALLAGPRASYKTGGGPGILDRKEVRGSAEYLLVGIDVAKDKHHAFFGRATGKTLFKRLVFENSKSEELTPRSTLGGERVKPIVL